MSAFGAKADMAYGNVAESDDATPTAHAHPPFTAKQSCKPLRSARCALDRRFEALCVEGWHTLDPPQTLGGVPDSGVRASTMSTKS